MSSPETATDSSSKSSTTSQRILIKYGGNAMKDPALQATLLEKIAQLHHVGNQIVIVHGGGPFIGTMMERLGMEYEFVGGHRKTDPATMEVVQMVLKGQVNSELVRLLLKYGVKAVGISGKDARLVTASKREVANKKGDRIDLGQVGDVSEVDARLIHALLRSKYLPVIAPISIGADFTDYNVNADICAGAIAGALHVDQFFLLTDVDGLMEDKDDPSTIMHKLTVSEINQLKAGVIQGGMLPKVDACLIALEEGAKTCRILNGTKPDQLLDALLGSTKVGTTITF